MISAGRVRKNRQTLSLKPFGWLLRVLQEEHADETAFRQALEVAVSEISRLRGTEDTHLREALNYLILLIFHARLETIETSQKLRELRRAALEVPSLEAFGQTLNSNRNS